MAVFEAVEAVGDLGIAGVGQQAAPPERPGAEFRPSLEPADHVFLREQFGNVLAERGVVVDVEREGDGSSCEAANYATTACEAGDGECAYANDPVACVLVDEAQFLTPEQVWQLAAQVWRLRSVWLSAWVSESPEPELALAR